jgi:putative hydrolase of the HAD superfamily
MPRLTGLIFDFGGVLTLSVRQWIGSYCEAHDVDPELFRAALMEEGHVRAAHHLLERGELGEREFEPLLAGALGLDEHEGLVERLINFMVFDEAMVDALRTARSRGIRTGLISNSFGDDRYDHQLFDELFDGVVISMHVRMRKPEPEIFLLGAERIGVSPEQVVFVDDLAVNCEAAESVGMTAVYHRDAAVTIPRLEELLGVSLRAD